MATGVVRPRTWNKYSPKATSKLQYERSSMATSEGTRKIARQQYNIKPVPHHNNSSTTQREPNPKLQNKSVKQQSSHNHHSTLLQKTTAHSNKCNCSIHHLQCWKNRLQALALTRSAEKFKDIEFCSPIKESIKQHNFLPSRLKTLTRDPCSTARWLANSVIRYLSQQPSTTNELYVNWLNTIAILKVPEFSQPLKEKTLSHIIQFHNKHLVFKLHPNLMTGKWEAKYSSIKKAIISTKPALSNKEQNRLTQKLKRQINRKIHRQSNHTTLPTVPYLPWINNKTISISNTINQGIKSLDLQKDIKHTSAQLHKIQLMYLNTRSLNKEKAVQLRAAIYPYHPDIIAFSEIRSSQSLNHWEKTYTITHNLTETGEGGVAMLISKACHIIQLNDTIDDIIIATIEKSGNTFIAAVTYLHSKTNKQDKLDQLLNAVHNQSFNYKNPTIFIVGDFNIPNQESFKNMLEKHEFITSFNQLRIIDDYNAPPEFKPNFTRKGVNKNKQIVYSRLDYLITNSNPTVKLSHHPIISDHCIFAIQANINTPIIRKISNYNRKQLTKDTSSLENLTLHHLIDFVRENKHHYLIQRKVEKIQQDLSNFTLPQDVNKQVKEWCEGFRSFAKDLTKLRFSRMQGLAFKIIRQITKYDQFLKRDGSVISIIKLSDGSIITKEEEVNQALITVLQKRENELKKNYGEHTREVPFPLPPLRIRLIKELIERIPKKKALTSFPIPDELLLTHNGFSFLMSLNSLWDPKFLLNHPEIFNCKLVPLNKVHPEVPHPYQMRPIVATNSLFKLLELRFNDTLNEKFNLLPKLANSQTGFIRGMSTQVNIKKLLDYLTKPYYSNPYLHGAPYVLLTQASPKYPVIDPTLHTYVLFIDYEQAYNSVNMPLLHQRMKNLKHEGSLMFDLKELDFIFWAYQQLNVQLGSQSFQTNYGVPQGGINSPILFDWAMYFAHEDLQEVINRSERTSNQPRANDENSFFFADDAAYGFHLTGPITGHKTFFKQFLQSLRLSSTKWGLNINWSKSAIMCILRRLGNAAITELSDEPAKFEGKGIHRKALLTFKYGDDNNQTHSIPLVKCYKYLGIYLQWNIGMEFHIQKTKEKIQYITRSLVAIRKASDNPKFCHNTWTTFIRPLLDYSIIYSYYTGRKGRQMLETLYRTSLKQMLFIKSYAPNDIIDKLIQYDYKTLYLNMMDLVQRKIMYRSTRTENKCVLSEKADFKYNPLDMNSISPNLIKTINLFYYRGSCKKGCLRTDHKAHGPEHWQEHINQDNPQFGEISKLIRDYINNLYDLTYSHDLVNSLLPTIICYLRTLIA